ncbi:aryl-sulfate sulfotransferase [Lacinutrix sp. C3R15]|uniref:aryl-sulfate sulfotransferase n=1 Tax=Flavobacteriaceae TaxID=49546 RepID=UPI001C082612|nr:MULTISPECIES: aryl-sulfate sulfotransferase [Flavobacteriaceae]MBU2939616.1 aryl-sulfate sulfotransferase [Lacinutrix sp. C3R15]MDO6622931.1 aryl-sulfate sulfotransferase [Oceanihabitans sp. 1_MG-2023]
MKIKLSFFILIFIFNNNLFSQNTIGLLENTNQAYDGYTLFTPEESNSVFLVDNCGRSIKTWTFSDTPKFTCYLLENGNLLRVGASRVEIRDWDDNLVWSYNLLVSNGLTQHHDIEPLPNGNILYLVKETLTEAEQIALGKNPALLNGPLSSEKIIEIEPVGTDAINIVWEWRFADHLIQDFDASKSNYGTVSTNPQLVDFNYTDANIDHSNWLHLNSIDYNPQLDHILFSSRTLSEIYIIDHSTTTAEAASHSGGNQNKGGDFLWRWGNPQVYRQGTADHQKLHAQHDAKWISQNYVNENKITVFNNNSDGTNTFSSIHIVSPSLDINNNYEIENNTFLPENYYWSWSGEILEETVFQEKKSGVHALENGNLLLCETKKGRLSEITLTGDIVWIYRNPVGETTFNQFATNVEIFEGNSIFRGEKYHKSYAAFTGRDLTPGNILENINSISETCATLSVTNAEAIDNTIIFNNPVVDQTLYFYKPLETTKVKVYNNLGQSVYTKASFSGNELKLPYLKQGLYFIEFIKQGTKQIEKIIIK